MAAMRVLRTESDTLKKRVIKNMSELGRSLEPIQLFNDVSPVLHDFDRMSLMRVLEGNCIPPLVFHKIWEALQRRPNWEACFVNAVRLQDNPRLLQILEIPDENVQDNGGVHRDQLDPGMRSVAGGQFQPHSFQYQPDGHASRPYHARTPRAAVSVGYHYGLDQGPPVQPQVHYSDHYSLDTKKHSDHSTEQFSSNTRGSRPDNSPHFVHDQTQKMQLLHNSRECQGVTKRDLVKNVTACLYAQSTGLATPGGQRQQTESRLSTPEHLLPGFQDQSQDRYYVDNEALPFATNYSSCAQNTLGASSASSAISDAATHHAMFLEHPVCGESPYNIKQSLDNNNAYSCAVENPDRLGYKAPTLPLDASQSRESKVDKETLTSTGFTATPPEGLPDLKEDSEDAGNSGVYQAEQADVLPDTASVTSTQTGHADQPRPPLERQTSQTPFQFSFGNVENLVIEKLVIRESGVTVIGADNSVNMMPPTVAQTRRFNTVEEERTTRHEESGNDEHEHRFHETEREPCGVPEAAGHSSPQSPVNRQGWCQNSLAPQAPSYSGTILVDETERESQLSTSLSESVCLSTNPFSSADLPQMMNLKTPDEDIIRIEDSMPQTRLGEECPGKLSFQAKRSDTRVSNPESLHLAWGDPRHETFVKVVVDSGGSDQHENFHVTSQKHVNTNTAALAATENITADHRAGGSRLCEAPGNETNDPGEETTLQKYIDITEARTATPTADSVPIQSAQPTTLDHAQTSLKIRDDQINPETQTQLRPPQDPMRQDNNLASSDLVEDAVSGRAPPQGSVSVETFLEPDQFSCDHFLESGAGSDDVTVNTRLLDGACSQTDDGARERGAYSDTVALKKQTKNRKDKSDKKSLFGRSKRQKHTKEKTNQCCCLQ